MKKIVFVALAIAGFLLGWPIAENARAQQAGQLACSQSVQYDASTNGSTRIFTATATSPNRVYLCDFLIVVGGTATNVQFKSGTGTNCGTNTANLTPNFVLPINGQLNFGSGIWEGLTVAAGQDLCIVTSAGNPVQALVTYTYQ